MADNKLLLKRDADEDFFAADDPLAELARIANLDQAPVAKAAAYPQRREPAFDLEDELLRELEIYQQPAAVEPPSAAVPAAEPELEVAPAVEHTSREPQVELELAREPAILEAVETFADASEGRVYERPASHPVFDLEDEILREFAAFDARRVSRTEEHPVEAEVIHQDLPAAAPVPVELHDVPDVRSMINAPFAREQGRDIYESFRGDDLDDAISNALSPELEETVAAPLVSHIDPVPVEEEAVFHGAEDVADPVSEPEPEVYWADLGAGIDIGEEAAAPQVEVATPQVEVHADAGFGIAHAPEPEPVAFVEPSIEDFVEPVDDELVSQDFADVVAMPEAVPVEPIQETASFVTSDAAAPSSSMVQSSSASQSSSAVHYDLDALLAEVETYPVADNSGRWGVHSKSIADEEVAKAAPPVVQNFAPQVGEWVSTPVEPEIPVVDAQAEADAVALDDGNFELDLSDIELDLSDLNEDGVDASPELLSELAAEPVDAPVVEPVPVLHHAASRSAAADYSSLPYDPSQVAEEEETFEAIGEFDVPELTAAHHDEPPAQHPEYDIDLDAEMAQLFATATAQPATSPRPGQPVEGLISIAGAQSRSQPGSLDLDEFERALEEDFRRSFTENRAGSQPDRVALAPVYAEAPQGRGRRGLLLLASAVVAVVVFGGAGVYAFMSGDTKILTSSEPKVIMADTDPVKVVPDDPGGKQVPNQNKAVYDRVAGAKPDETKQENLLTSNEEPVDVVQRTLMPESLPMDDDSMALATPTGDTIDPRLLPDEEEGDRVTTTNKVVSGVSPRKVKTMVVRPDGTLVEREVTEEDLKQQATNDAELMKIAQKAARDAATANDSQSDEIAKAIENVPERLAPNDETAVKPVTPVETKVVDVEPVTPVEPAKVEAEQPVVAEKPADVAVTPAAKTDLAPVDVAAEEKPAEVVAETKPVETQVAETPVETAVTEKPVERSIAVDAEQPAITQDAAVQAADADVADAPVRKVKTTKITPVPEVRPVDQPVTVVGTVTDQGTVQSDADAKPQEVALADAAKQTPAESATLPAGSYVIQIASLPSENEAQTSYSRLSAKFAGIIGGRGVDIRRAEIKNKGTYYRVRIPAGSKQEAQALCSQYKKAGGSCLVSK